MTIWEPNRLKRLLLIFFSVFSQAAFAQLAKIYPERSSVYKDCDNRFLVEMSPESDSGEISAQTYYFYAENAKLEKPSQSPVVFIKPAGEDSVVFKVEAAGVERFRKVFDVKPLPPPKLYFFADGKIFNVKAGTTAPGPNAIKIRLNPDKRAVQYAPRDLRYSIDSISVSLRRDGQALLTVGSAGDFIKLERIVKNAKPGDYLHIQIHKISRKSFDGKSHGVLLKKTDYTAPLR